ncbi:MAG: hypothetical protein GF401_00045 [Chitinivibrionales bacterium]|nr:hypothetical protein [Chitinivibrionales bacterium]
METLRSHKQHSILRLKIIQRADTMGYERISTEAVLKGKVRKDFAWEIISDYSRYPQIMESVDKVTIQERNNGHGRSEWFVTIEEAPLTWIERDYYDRDNYEIRFESIDGDFDTINGRWKVEDYDKGGIKINFDIDYHLGIPVIEEVLGDILRRKMKANMDSMVNAIKNELSRSQINERQYERYDIGKYSTICLNGHDIRTYIVNVSQKGMMFYYDGQFEDTDITLKIGDIRIEAEELYNDLKHKNARIIFREPTGPERLRKLIDILSNQNVRLNERKLIEKEVVLSSNDTDVNVYLINISRKGMLFSYDSVPDGIGDTVSLCGVPVEVRDIYHDVKSRTMRTIFSQALNESEYAQLLEQIEQYDAVTEQTELPL